MTTLLQKPLSDKPQTDISPEPQGCRLGCELGNCPLKRIDCGSLYDALLYITPPWSIREYVKATMGDDPAARQWLAHLDAVTPNMRPVARPLDWWR